MRSSPAHLRAFCAVGTCLLALLGCERKAPPGPSGSPRVVIQTSSSDTSDDLSSSSGDAEAGERFGSLDDNLPFRPGGEKLASIAWRTWIYTDTGPARTRLGYLRVGAVVDARGPLIQNAGCEGGWLRINPRGFVCLGKGATTDLSHPMVRQFQFRPVRGEGFPYHYAMSRSRPPDRYFRLPSQQQMIEIEGREVLDRAAAFRKRAAESHLEESLGLSAGLPDFLDSSTILQKPYGSDTHLRRTATSGRASAESGFALLDAFYWEQRAFALTSEMDLVALDRLELAPQSRQEGVLFGEEDSLPVGFVVDGAALLWRKQESGQFVQKGNARRAEGFVLTGARAKDGLVETKDGDWIAQSALRVLPPRDSFPSVATGRRKWIDVSIKDQALVAYEGTRPVYATLLSAGRGGLGDEGDSNPDANRTVRGTFMIHEKTVSSRMDGDDDRADSFDLQDVPFVQYFHRGFALHGAYWHDEFGRQRSHGCINLSARDSAWLFEWTDPPVPPDWHAVINKKRGTVVHVRY